MSPRSPHTIVLWIVATVAAAGCSDVPTRTVEPRAAQRDAVKFWEALQSTRWNTRATTLLSLRPPANGQAAASRILTYLSLAQYRAVLAAEENNDGSTHPSVPAAVGYASATVLKSFFASDAATIDQWLAGDLVGPQWPGAKNQDLTTGAAIGQHVAQGVIDQAARDNYALALSVGTPPVGDGYWYSNGTPIVRSLWGTTPFFLESVDQFRAPPPPVYKSAEFYAGLDVVLAISLNRSDEQLAIANLWNTGFTASRVNLVADGLIVDHHRSEREAVRILAYANTAAFDAQLACWDSKLTYWYIRPGQADDRIKTVFPAPNHPSYPSGHSCIVSSFLSVLIDALPSERDYLEGLIEQAGWSRVYAGIHYPFDVEAGQAIGTAVAELALRSTLR